MVWWITAIRLSGLGLYIVVCIVGGVALGVWLDRTLETGVVFLLVGLAVGSITAFYGTYRMVAAVVAEDKRHIIESKGR